MCDVCVSVCARVYVCLCQCLYVPSCVCVCVTVCLSVSVEGEGLTVLPPNALKETGHFMMMMMMSICSVPKNSRHSILVAQDGKY